MLSEIRQWFQRRMLPETFEGEADDQVRVFTVVDERWRALPDWPPPGASTERLYLHSQGAANSKNGDGVLTSRWPASPETDAFQHNLSQPVPAVGGLLWPVHNLAPGPLDQSQVEERADVLVYTSDLLLQPKSLMGPIEAVLQIESADPAIHVAVKLVDLHPDGFAQILTEGIARFDRGESGDTVRTAHVQLPPTGHTYLPGHRFRIEVAGSNFPKYEMIRRSFEVKVHSGGDRPSYLEFTLGMEG